ncbi:MAG: hypothetical protein ABFE08_08510, partial [Armatimonadia bacterium]
SKHVLLVLSRPEADPLAKHTADLESLVKSLVPAYTRKDGTLVKEHDNGKQASAERPAFKKGHRVKIKPEFQDKGDDEFDWHVVGDEEKGRVDISPHGTGMSIPPKYTVQSHMIEHHPDQRDEEAKKPSPYKGEENGPSPEAQKLFDAAKAKKAPKPKMHKVGDSVHHAGHNKTGMIMKVDGDKYHVMHTGGKDVWDHKDVSKVREG